MLQPPPPHARQTSLSPSAHNLLPCGPCRPSRTHSSRHPHRPLHPYRTRHIYHKGCPRDTYRQPRLGQACPIDRQRCQNIMHKNYRSRILSPNDVKELEAWVTDCESSAETLELEPRFPTFPILRSAPQRLMTRRTALSRLIIQCPRSDAYFHRAPRSARSRWCVLPRRVARYCA